MIKVKVSALKAIYSLKMCTKQELIIEKNKSVSSKLKNVNRNQHVKSFEHLFLNGAITGSVHIPHKRESYP